MSNHLCICATTSLGYDKLFVQSLITVFCVDDTKEAASRSSWHRYHQNDTPMKIIFPIHQHRSRLFWPLEIEKHHGIIFTCLATRAVNFKKCPDLTTDSMINAMSRFTARRDFFLNLCSSKVALIEPFEAAAKKKATTNK